jgi:hypothetical protein
MTEIQNLFLTRSGVLNKSFWSFIIGAWTLFGLPAAGRDLEFGI